MSIKLTLEAPGLNLSAHVKDSALPDLIRLVQEARDDSVPPPIQAGPSRTSFSLFPREKTSATVTIEETKQHLKSLGAAELLNFLKKWDSYPEKVVLLGAWREAHTDGSAWRSADMDEAFRQAKESAPSNFPRDISKAIKEGWIHAVTPRTYTVTGTGWSRISQALAELQNERETT